MTTERDVDDFLAHYGVKGMKWGVRKQAAKAAVSEMNQIRKDRKAAIKDVNKLRRINRSVGTGKVAKRETQKSLISERSAQSPAYARKVKIESAKTQADRRAEAQAKASLAVAGALWIATSPKVRSTVITSAKFAGMVYGRATESEVSRYLRKNAYTPTSDLNIIDVGLSGLQRLGR